MSEQSSRQARQDINISDNASLENSQVAVIAGRYVILNQNKIVSGDRQEDRESRVLLKLKRLQQTDRCKELLSNPDKLGYISVYEALAKIFTLIALTSYVIVVLFRDLIYDPKILGNISSGIHVLLLVVCLYIFLIFTRHFVLDLKDWFRGERLVKWEHITPILVWVVERREPTFSELYQRKIEVDRFTLLDVEAKPYEVIQPVIGNRAVLFQDALGVVYLKRQKFGSLRPSWRIVDFKKL